MMKLVEKQNLREAEWGKQTQTQRGEKAAAHIRPKQARKDFKRAAVEKKRQHIVDQVINFTSEVQSFWELARAINN